MPLCTFSHLHVSRKWGSVTWSPTKIPSSREHVPSSKSGIINSTIPVPRNLCRPSPQAGDSLNTSLGLGLVDAHFTLTDGQRNFESKMVGIKNGSKCFLSHPNPETPRMRPWPPIVTHPVYSAHHVKRKLTSSASHLSLVIPPFN